MAGTLFVVATPIGNLDDPTIRASKVLAAVGTVVAEDTRRTRQLLAHLGLEAKPLRRLDAHASERDIEAMSEKISLGEEVALCTDAGTPGVSDPGAALVAAVRAKGGTVVPVPGASAVTTALSASGYAVHGFRFAGFLPRSGMERARAIADIGAARDAVVLFEAPQRLIETLKDLAETMAERRATIARELTKLHEQILEGEIRALLERFRDQEILGEITVVLAPWSPAESRAEPGDIDRRIEEALGSGMRARDIAERIALETGWTKRDVYERVIKRKR